MDNISYTKEIVNYIKRNSTCVMEINQNKCINKDPYLFSPKNLINLNKMILLYNQIFKENITCIIFVGDIPFNAVSFEGVIALNNKLYEKPYTFIYKYLPHEMIHQCNGCKIKYIGHAKEWLRESLTEYVQLVMLKKILGNKFYNDQIKEYVKMDTISGDNTKVNLYQFDSEKDRVFLNSLVYGRGVLLFRKIINDDINLLTQLFYRLKKLKSNVSLIDFMNILGEVSNINTDLIIRNFIKGNEVIVK